MTTTSDINLGNTLEDEWQDLDDININELGSLLDDPVPKLNSSSSLRTSEQYEGFNNVMGKTWLYPSNLPERCYQYNITQAALYKNTLVVLPTGLGKTFIAAVVMHNFARWYPCGKIIFMAPTRPLVAQQIEACQRIMPFQSADTIELTGRLQRERRYTMWRSKRVFFATPQVVQADMISQGETLSDFPYNDVKLVVVDEAHKAKGRYAYTEVVQALWRRNRRFRLLALSATPGRTMDDVAEVIKNLFISHVEVRWDNSIDVLPYVHKRSIKTVVVPIDEELKRIHTKMNEIIDPYVRQLVDAGVLSGSHQQITRNFLLFEQKRFREQSFHQTHPQQSAVNSNFSICISLFHALELLERHGLRVFVNYFDDDDDGREKFVLAMNPALRNLVDNIRVQLGPNPFDISANAMTNGVIATMPANLDFGHPKFEEARKCLLKHFEDKPESRAMVFCEYRESVMLIYRLLLQHVPKLRPKCLVGQGGTALRALSQKQQIQIMNDFRAGTCNILIATSIAEEGIDVGEVDLIVCFDINTSNPTRFVQRIGRTGRKRQGEVIMLVTAGKEQKILQEVLANRDQTNKRILRSPIVQAALFKEAPRLVPTELSPECVKVFIKPPTPERELDTKTTKKVTKKQLKTKEKITEEEKKKKKDLKNSQDLRKFFDKPKKSCQPKMDDIIDLDDFEVPVSEKTVLSQRSKNHIERLFKDISVSSHTNTQLMEAESVSTTPKKSGAKFETQELKRLNKFFKSKCDLRVLNKNLANQLKSTEFSTATKLLLLKERHAFMREICVQMAVLKALPQMDLNVTEMSREELEIRETYEAAVSLFEDSTALSEFLEKAQNAEQSKKHSKLVPFDDLEMTAAAFDRAVDKIFADLNVQDSNCDNFEWRQSELVKTKGYQRFLDAQRRQKENGDSKVFRQSTVFNAPPADENTFQLFENFENSKCTTQWEADFAPSRVLTKSTPIPEPFTPTATDDRGKRTVAQQQQLQQPRARRKLEVLNEKSITDQSIDRRSSTLDRSAETSKLASHCSEPLSVKATMDFEKSFLQRQQSTPIQPKAQVMKSNSTPAATNESLAHELDFDLDFFTEPLPEEIVLQTSGTIALSGSSVKENKKPNNSTMKANVSDLFRGLESTPVNSLLTPKTKSKITPKITPTFLRNNESSKTPNMLDQTYNDASSFDSPKLASTAVSRICIDLTNDQENIVLEHKNRNENSPQFKSSLISNDSPKSRPNTLQHASQYETSPSIFDRYVKGKVRLEALRKQRRLKQNLVPTSPQNKTSENMSLNSTAADSPIIRRPIKVAVNLKRRIIESESESENETCVKKHQNNSDSDFEEVRESPQIKRRCLPKTRTKSSRRLQLCSFIDEEAEQSGGSGHTDEENGEETLGGFVCDSVIVADDATQENATQMQAVYLQSVKSPIQRHVGGFKMPAPRVYNDAMDIFSQPVPIEPTQYDVNDSFVVHDENEALIAECNTTLCPLEKAELILKQRRREAKRRRYAEVGGVSLQQKRGRKCYQLDSESD